MPDQGQAAKIALKPGDIVWLLNGVPVQRKIQSVNVGTVTLVNDRGQWYGSWLNEEIFTTLPELLQSLESKAIYYQEKAV